jgi:hypothetical protein
LCAGRQSLNYDIGCFDIGDENFYEIGFFNNAIYYLCVGAYDSTGSVYKLSNEIIYDVGEEKYPVFDFIGYRDGKLYCKVKNTIFDSTALHISFYDTLLDKTFINVFDTITIDITTNDFMMNLDGVLIDTLRSSIYTRAVFISAIKKPDGLRIDE